MKKFLYMIIFAFLTCFIFLGCSSEKLNLNSNKPNNFYYTNKLAKEFAIDKLNKCIIMDTNFYKEKELKEKDIPVIKSFLSSLNKNNFLNSNKDFPSKPEYKIFLTFEKDKFVVNIYNDKFITIHPWDGEYSVDYINMNGIPLSYNLYNLCDYIINK